MCQYSCGDSCGDGQCVNSTDVYLRILILILLFLRSGSCGGILIMTLKEEEEEAAKLAEERSTNCWSQPVAQSMGRSVV